MEPAWIESATAWIAANPIAAGAAIFLIAFCDALVILGIVVPALPLLFAVGALVGLGHINGPYALVCATLGAFIVATSPLGLFGVHSRWQGTAEWTCAVTEAIAIVLGAVALVVERERATAARA